MRSLILVVISAFVLGTGGLAYFWMQPSGRRNPAGKAMTPSGPVSLEHNDTGSQLGGGEKVAMKKYDQRTGEQVSEFSAEKYVPQKGGKIAVEDATARFFLSDGQVLQIHGVTGQFVGNGGGGAGTSKQGMPASQMQAPTRGRMQDVTLAILDKAGATTMTIAMNNAAFDSENSTIYTEGYTDAKTGEEIPADRVKVTIRSPESNPAGYDFDGTGLRMAWNERDHRLAKLDIAHGESLLVRNPKGLSRPKSEPSTQAALKNQAPGAKGVESASVKDAGKRPPAGESPFAPNTDPPIYRAVFRDNVRIVQNGLPMATAERMSIDFWMKSGGDSPKPTTGPANAIPVTANTTQPSMHPIASTNGPTSRPAEESPVNVYWTGPLHVEPYPQGAATVSDSIVTFDGSPVVAKQQASEIKADRLVYHTEEGSVRGTASPGEIVTMTTADAHGDSVITTTMLEYYSKTQPPRAILSGKSVADLPAQADGSKMRAAWLDRCVLQFQTGADGRSAIRDADITGSVNIDHPQLNLRANRIELAFDTSERAVSNAPTSQANRGAATRPASQPSGMMQTNLKRLVASDAVHCVMTDASRKSETIDCNALTLLTEFSPEGKMVPRTVNADGNVHAVDADQDLRAGHLAVTLAPATRPARGQVATSSPAASRPTSAPSVFGGNVDLQSLIAHESVHVIGRKDGTEVFADTMLVDKKDGKTTVKFLGQPIAKIVQKNNVIVGTVIDVSPDGQVLVVDGPGAMHGQQQDAAGVTPKPVDVTWTRSLHVDGKGNTVDAVGEVVANSTDSDGTINTVRGDRARLLLVDVASTQPASRLATAPASGPATKEAVAKKNIRQAVFQDHASVSSTLLDNDGNPLRRMNLFSEWVQYDVLQPTAGPTTMPVRKMTVPGPGKMLVEDYRAPTTHPAAAGSGDVASSRGATAFQWSKSLTYDDATHQAVLLGGVVIDHRDDVQKEDSLRLIAEVVVAELQPLAVGPVSKPSTSRPSATQPEEAKFQVRRITAGGNLLVTLRGGQLQCDHIVYDPVTRILTAYGNEKVDAVFVRTGSAAVVRAEQMQWDAKSELPKIIKGRASFRR